MSQDGFHRLQDLFERAATLAGDERIGFLDRECGADAGLRRELDGLLARDGQGVSELRAGVGERAAVAIAEGALEMPERIGPYEILGLVGRGGMGVVYRARQENPERVVALKVLRPALFSEQLAKRFELEKQVLARLQHSGIAQIFEAGTADLGLGTQPWFAMELIDGEQLSVWATGRSTAEKLELAARICDAVHHAHQRGVIHRDLKPDNILVVAGGDPKVLDFGVARVTDSDLQLTTIVADMRSLVGTLPYMSPEQASGASEKLDTRSDVYALGVLTYELLTGGLPYDLRDKSVAAAVRVITDEDPCSLSSVDRVFRGDLETIVGKALEKEPEGRYASAAEMGADLRRFLRNEPIQARPASTIYQLKKFARRNRGLVGGLAAAFSILVAAVIGLTILNVKAKRATVLAKSKVAMSDGVNDYLERILGSASPTANYGDMGRSEEGLEISTELASRFPEGTDRGPHLQARLHHAQMLLENGNPEEAETFCRQAMAGELDDTGQIRGRYVMARIRIERGEVEEGERELTELRVEADEVLGPRDPLRTKLGLEISGSPGPEASPGLDERVPDAAQ